jgi:hypothetical protein
MEKNGSNLSASFQSDGGLVIAMQSGFSSIPNVSLGSGGVDCCGSIFEATCLRMAFAFQVVRIVLFSGIKYLEALIEILRALNGGIKP